MDQKEPNRLVFWTAWLVIEVVFGQLVFHGHFWPFMLFLGALALVGVPLLRLWDRAYANWKLRHSASAE